MTTYAQLVTDVQAWAKRSDIEDKISGFVSLVEARFNRDLRVRQMEAALSGTIDANLEIALPNGFLAVKAVWPTLYEGSPLTSQSLESVVSSGDGRTGIPSMYAVTSDALRFDGTGAVSGVYFTSIPGLEENESNWLSVLAPDAYFFAVLAEASWYSLDEARATTYTARAAAAIQHVIDTDQRDRSSGPLIARKR